MNKKLIYKSSNFSLLLGQKKKETNLTMKVHSPYVNTSDIPDTSNFLKENYPGVLRTTCFNEQNLPFNEEVKATEIGHLFEHIILEEICSLKITEGSNTVTHNGRTYWNWIKDTEGTFHIILDTNENDSLFLEKALQKAINLTEDLLSINKPYGQPRQLPVE